jgi:hypothetical protein
VLCYIAEGKTGACDRYANVAGELTRVDPHVIIEEAQGSGAPLVPFAGSPDWDGGIVTPGGLSSPRSAPAPPIRTTSPRRSSSPARSTASTW